VLLAGPVNAGPDQRHVCKLRAEALDRVSELAEASLEWTKVAKLDNGSALPSSESDRGGAFRHQIVELSPLATSWSSCVGIADDRRPGRKVLQRNSGGGVGSGRWCS
jgi:hypothetical protein